VPTRLGLATGFALLLGLAVPGPVLGQADAPPPASDATESAREPFTLAAGAPFGVGFTVAGAVCLSMESQHAGSSCSVRAMETSAERIRAVDAGLVDAAIVQSDWLAQAVAGGGLFEADGPNDRLATIARLHSEDFVLLIRADQPGSPESLDGQSVDVSPDGSYPHAIATLLFGALRLEPELEQEGAPIGFEARVQALCDGAVRAAGFVAAQPHVTLAAAAQRCGLKAIGWPDAALDAAVSAFPGLRVEMLPEALGSQSGERTVGLRQILIARRDMPAERAEDLARAVLTAREDIVGNVAVWHDVTPASLAEVGPLQLHEGAARAYRTPDGN
jgi:TRAP transporter TAXI family solute receptor